MRKAYTIAGAAAGGFVLTVVAGLAVVGATGFDLVCKKQILCSVSEGGSSLAGQVRVSWTQAPSRSLTVTWKTGSSRNPALLEYKPAGSQEWRSVIGQSLQMPRNGIIRQRGFLHRATVTGLAPDSAYEYRVSNDSRAKADMRGPFRTRTAPEGESASFSFVYFADTGLIGRPDGLASGTQQIRDFIARSGAAFLLGGGDYAYGNADARFVFPMDAADEWFRQWEPVLSRLPLMAQYGNHEAVLREKMSQWLPRFAHPAGYDDGRAYSFDVGCTHFTGMFAPGDGYLPPDDLLRWLDEDLRKARENGACWLIVYQHDALYGHGLSHPSDPRLRDLLIPILERHRVDLHLASQDQSYERTYPLRSGPEGAMPVSLEASAYEIGDGVIYAKVSPAGKKSEKHHDFSRLIQPKPPQVAVRSDDGHHFARVTVRGREGLLMEVLKLRDGDAAPFVFDRVTIGGPRAPAVSGRRTVDVGLPRPDPVRSSE